MKISLNLFVITLVMTLSVPVVQAQKVNLSTNSVPTNRIDNNILDAFLGATANAGIGQGSVFETESYFSNEFINPQTTRSDGSVMVEASADGGHGLAQGLNSTIAVPGPGASVFLASLDLGSLHEIFAEAIALGDAGSATIVSEQFHLTNHEVLLPVNPVGTPDGWYTLRSHLHLLAQGADTDHIGEAILHAHVGESFVTATYIGDGNFEIVGSLQTDVEFKRGEFDRGLQGLPHNIYGIFPGGLNHHYYATELVGPGPLNSETFAIHCVELTQTGVSRGGPVCECEDPPLGQDADIWTFNTFASGYVVDLK